MDAVADDVPCAVVDVSAVLSVNVERSGEGGGREKESYIAISSQLGNRRTSTFLLLVHTLTWMDDVNASVLLGTVLASSS